jgi:hypothetical protein
LILEYDCGSLADIVAKVDPDAVVFQLQGRLGNQLFGISEAWDIHKKREKHVILDLTPIIAAGFSVPLWVASSRLASWAHLVINSRYLYNDERVNVVSASSEQFPSSVRVDRYFNGFRPNLEHIEKSGFFSRGKLGSDFFPSPCLGNENFIALSLRIGDYKDNPHLGILPGSYFKKSLELIPENLKFLPRIIFTDDSQGASNFLAENKISYDSIYPASSAELALSDLSTAKVIIGSNSTFSFWAQFFSQAKNFTPTPFYIAQPKWGESLIPETFTRVKYTKSARVKYLQSRIERKITSFQPKP